MRTRDFILAGILMLALLPAPVARAAEPAGNFQVMYAEPITVALVDGTGSPAKTTSSARTLAFDAYGRRFELDLEINARLLASLDAAQRSTQSSNTYYRGTVRGLAGSWVRLAYVRGELHGAIWDGSDLYALEPARMVNARALTAIDALPGAPVVYRLSDLQFDSRASFCGVTGAAVELTPAGRKTGLQEYKDLVSELQASAELSGELEMAIIGDAEFTGSNAADPTGSLLARMNIVDGIFSEQVGVILTFPEVVVFNNADTDPFTESDAELLLRQLGGYRTTTPSVLSRGLAHLFTGRDMTGTVVGVAFLDALCESTHGVGLSESRHGTTTSALIAAHEVGHNFGAPHDAEPASPCETTSPTFLMAPNLNGSDDFSQCSLDQMAPRVAAASCIRPAEIVDATVSAPPTVTGVVNTVVEYPIDVSSIGQLTATNVIVNTFLSGFFTVDSATAENGTCTVQPGSIRCDLGSLPVATTRRITLRLVPGNLSNITGTVRVTATNDRAPENNEQAIRVVVNPQADVAVTAMTPSTITGVTRATFTSRATIAATGVTDSQGVLVNVDADPHQLISVTPSAGSCVIGGFNRATCDFGVLAQGSTRTVDVTYEGRRAGQTGVSVSVQSQNDGNSSNNTRSTILNLDPAADAGVRLSLPANPPAVLAVDRTMDYSVFVDSVAGQPIENVTINILNSFTLEAVSVTAEGGTCTTPPAVSCDLGTLAPQTTRRIDVRVRGTRVGSGRVTATVVSPFDDNPQNNRRDVTVHVKHPVDLGIAAIGIPPLLFEGRSGTQQIQIVSNSADPASAAVVTATMPISFRVLSASIPGATCSVSANTATCTLATLAPGAFVVGTLEVRNPDVGQFTGNVTVTATGDGEPNNNTANVNLTVHPFHDATLETTADTASGMVNEPFDLHVDIVNGPRAAAGGFLDIEGNPSFPSNIALVSWVNPLGTCAPAFNRIRCDISGLAASSANRVTVRLRGPEAIQFGLRAFLQVQDNFFDNNGRNITVSIDSLPELFLSAADTVSVRTNESLTLPFGLINSGTLPTQDISFAISVPGGLTVERITQSRGSCANVAGAITCQIGSLPGRQSAGVELQLRGSQAGTFTVTSQATVPGDQNPADNSAVTSITLTAPPAPPSSGGGGGGGGSLGAMMIGMLAVAFGARSIRRKRAPVLRQSVRRLPVHSASNCNALEAMRVISSKRPSATHAVGVSQLPPQATTEGTLRYSARLPAVIPPVGMKRTSRNTAERAISMAGPPT